VDDRERVGGEIWVGRGVSIRETGRLLEKDVRLCKVFVAGIKDSLTSA
jgi:hypothetical protein